MLKEIIKRNRRRLLIFYIAVLLPALISSEEMVLHRFSSDEPAKSLEHVLYLAAGTALVEAGISSTRTNKNYDYILRTEYSIDNSNLFIQYSLFPVPKTKRPAATYGFHLHIDHEIDTQVAVAVRQILVQAGIEPASGMEAEIEGLFSKQRPAEAEVAAPRVRRTEELQRPSAEEGKDRSSGTSTAPDLENADQLSARVKFTAAFSPAGFLFFGEMTEYFHYGFGGSLTAGAVWPSKKHSVFFGTDAAVVRVVNDKDVTGGPLYISMSGIAAGYGTGTSVPYRLSAAVAGGAAFLTLAGADAAMTKTVPYVKLSVFLGLPVSTRVYIGGSASFFTVFDEDALITSASPSIQMRVEL